MKKYPTIITFLLSALLAGCSQTPDPMDSLTILQKGNTRLGILDQTGGRPVFLSQDDSTNLIYSNASLWPDAAKIGREHFENNDWTGFNGHIMWIGPQADFWNGQDICPEKQGEPWPPDPYLTMLPFEVSAKTESSIKLLSPESPVSGLQLQNEITLIEEGRIHLKTIATNIRDTEITKDLWSNTRFTPDNRFFVPIQDESNVKIDLLGQEAIPAKYEDGFFHFESTDIATDAPWSNKAFVSPRLPYIAKFSNGHLFIKLFAAVPTDQIHPDQGAVEIYLDLPRENSDGLLELEAHGPLLTLAPDETMSWEENWIILPYKGDNSVEAQKAFLKSWEEENFPN